MERLKTEMGELHKSKRQLIELVEQKDLELSEKNANIKSYLDKIVSCCKFIIWHCMIQLMSWLVGLSSGRLC